MTGWQVSGNTHLDHRAEMRRLLQVLTAFSFPELEEYDDLESSTLQPSGRYQGEEVHLEMVGADEDDDLQSKRRNSGDRLLGPKSGFGAAVGWGWRHLCRQRGVGNLGSPGHKSWQIAVPPQMTRTLGWQGPDEKLRVEYWR